MECVYCAVRAGRSNFRHVKSILYTTTYTNVVNHKDILFIYIPPTQQKYSTIVYYNDLVYTEFFYGGFHTY
jgi:hypothetical protein